MTGWSETRLGEALEEAYEKRKGQAKLELNLPWNADEIVSALKDAFERDGVKVLEVLYEPTEAARRVFAVWGVYRGKEIMAYVEGELRGDRYVTSKVTVYRYRNMIPWGVLREYFVPLYKDRKAIEEAKRLGEVTV
jgi:hypothetical protein